MAINLDFLARNSDYIVESCNFRTLCMRLRQWTSSYLRHSFKGGNVADDARLESQVLKPDCVTTPLNVLNYIYSQTQSIGKRECSFVMEPF
jgi:hypothetical protein